MNKFWLIFGSLFFGIGISLPSIMEWYYFHVPTSHNPATYSMIIIGTVILFLVYLNHQGYIVSSTNEVE